jgi:serine/threonine protein kinase
VNKTTDIYSFGVMMAEIFSGFLPQSTYQIFHFVYKGRLEKPIHTYKESYENFVYCDNPTNEKDYIYNFIAKACDADPAKRFTDANELISGLECLIDNINNLSAGSSISTAPRG